MSDLTIGYPDRSGQSWSEILRYQVGTLTTDAKIIVLQWGRGTGKTHTMMLRVMLEMTEWPGLRVLWIAPSYRVLYDADYPVVRDIMECQREQCRRSDIVAFDPGEQPDFDAAEWDDVTGETAAERLPKGGANPQLVWCNGSTITFRTAANIDQMRGGSYGLIVIEEAGYVQADEHTWAAFLPCLRGRGPLRIIAGGTPLAGDGVLGMCLALAQKDPTIYVSRAGTEDNPHYPRALLEIMRTTFSPEMYAQEARGEVIQRSGRVYSEYRDDLHAGYAWDWRKELADPSWDSYAVIDWGYHLSHVLFAAVRQPDRRRLPEVVIYQDWPLERMDADTICTRIIQQAAQQPRPIRAVVTDPQGFNENRTAQRFFSSYKIPVVFERNANRARIEHTLEYVRRLLRAQDESIHLHISRDVTALECNRTGGRGCLEGFRTYRLQERGAGLYLSRPHDDNHSVHGMDCIRMLCICFPLLGYVWPAVPSTVNPLPSARGLRVVT
jgi:hypothetical protein